MDPERFPGADEGNCNGVDNDCDDRLDEDVGYRIIYCDGDGDDYGDPLPLLVQCGDDGCEGYPVDNGDDCNDDDPLINPDMPDDDCDDEDENCSGYADEQAPPLYVDTDQDGYGNPDLAIRCVDMQVGLSDNGLDCNDQEASIRPRTEDEEDFDGCDELDNDCDAFIDEDEPKPTFWPDFDGDGYGTDDSDDYTPLESCTTPPPVEGFNWVPLKNDCDEEDPDISPGATELCDTDVDEDCDTDIDESFCL